MSNLRWKVVTILAVFVVFFGLGVYPILAARYHIPAPGWLMAKQLNKIPIAGSVVKYDGLELVAERSAGRRNRIGTVIVTRISSEESEADARADAATRIVAEQARAS